MRSLPERLSAETSEVAYRSRRHPRQEELRGAIERGYVHVLFTGTDGGTELGFEMDQERSDVASVDWAKGEGRVVLVGELRLDGVPVRCVAELDVGSLEGTGKLEVLNG